MVGLFKLLATMLAVAWLGSVLSNVNPDACSRGELACGTAWWKLGCAGLALVYAVLAGRRLLRMMQPPRAEDESVNAGTSE